MPPEVHAIVYVHTSSEGLPWWQWVPLTFLGVWLGFKLVQGIVWLFGAPERRRFDRRVRAVRAAAPPPPYDEATVVAAAKRLWLATWPAWEAGDLRPLEPVADPGLLEDWNATLAGHRAHNRRFRAAVKRGPRVDHVGVVVRPEDDRDYVCVRIRGRLKTEFESPDGKRTRAWDPRYDYYWTLTRRDGDWIAFSVRDAEYGRRNILTEEISTPQMAAGRLAQALEDELRRRGAWEDAAPAEHVSGAFGAPDLSFTQWLERVLVPRLRAVAAGTLTLPGSSHVGTMAIRELGDDDPLVATLLAVDRLARA